MVKIIFAAVSLSLILPTPLWAQNSKLSKSFQSAITPSQLHIENQELVYRGKDPILWNDTKLLTTVDDTIAEINTHYHFPDIQKFTISVPALRKAFKDDNDRTPWPKTWKHRLGFIPKTFYNNSYAHSLREENNILVDTFFSFSIAYSTNGSQIFEDLGKFVEEAEDGKRNEVSASKRGNFMLAFIDDEKVPNKYRDPSPWNLNKIKVGTTENFAYKILLPGTIRCWKLRTYNDEIYNHEKHGTVPNDSLSKDYRGSLALFDLENLAQVCYQNPFGAVLPPTLREKLRKEQNATLTIVLGISYTSTNHEGRKEPLVIAQWELEVSSLSGKYVILTAGTPNIREPGVVIGLKFPTL